MFLRWTNSPNDYALMAVSFRESWRITFRALAQLIFTEKPLAGVLVLIAIALISPWCAVGAMVGALCGNTGHLLLRTYAQNAWRAGAAGFNCAVIGIIWGGFPAAGEANIFLLAAALLSCIVLESAVVKVLSRLGLPVLVLPATLTALAFSLVLAGPSSWLWMDTNAAFGELGIALAMLLVIVAIGLESPRDAVPVVVIGGSSALIATAAISTDVLVTAGLWAFTVAPAVLAMQMLCFGPSARSALAGLVAATIGSALWVLWSASSPMSWAPPLLLPYVVGVWTTIVLGRISAHCIWLNGALWQALRILWPRHAAPRTVVVLTGDIAPAPDQTSTLPPQALLLSHRVAAPRTSEWDACDQLRRALAELQPTREHFLIAELERCSAVRHIVTSSRDTRLERAGSINVSRLHGSAEQIVCSGCKRTERWPPGKLWRHYALRCAACGALLEPALLHNETGTDADRARTCIEDADIVLVVEPDSQSSGFLAVVEAARRRGSRLVVIKGRHTSFCPAPGDIMITGTVAIALAAISRLLTISKRFGRKRGRDLSAIAESTPS